jgi:hypothetical protein
MNHLEPKAVSIMLSDMVVREERTGKLTLVGCFNGFSAPNKFPWTSPRFYVTVAITNVNKIVPESFLTVNISERKSDVVVASAACLMRKPDGIPEPSKDDVFEIPIPFPGVTFPHDGIYELKVSFHKADAGVRTIHVKAINPKQEEE